MESDGTMRLAGMEVPILSTTNDDSLEWIQLSLPSSSSYSNHTSTAFPPKDYSSSCVLGNPSSYFIWKICQSRPNMLDIVQLASHKESLRNGLRLIFPDVLYPFAFVYVDERVATGKHYTLYALTVSGVAYLIRLRSNFDYASTSVVPDEEFLEYNTEIHAQDGAITVAVATTGCLVVGRSNGSVHCFQLGVLEPSAPGYVVELRDDAGLGRLWGILSRSSTPAAVQDLVISEVQKRRLLFVLHSDGSIRVWDLFTSCKIFSYALTMPELTGTFVRILVGESKNDTGIIPFATLHKQNLEVETETAFLYDLRCNFGERTPLSLDPSYKRISLGRGVPVDVRLTSNKLWILNEEGLVVHDVFYDDIKQGSAHYYNLQETYITDLLFQSSDNSSDDLLWLAYAAFSSCKEEVASFVSSIFLRGLLFPGVHCNAVLRQTLGGYHKHYSDSEFGSFTVDGLKNEILSLIESQVGCITPVSVCHWWKSFCMRFINNWCKINAACGLLVNPSTGAIGIVRKNTISLCRSLEDVEHMANGFIDGQNHTSPELNDENDQKLLLEFLGCVRKVRHQLGQASSAIFYESLLSTTPNMSSEEVVPRLAKILETGFSSLIASMQVSELGADAAWEKDLSNHRNLRRFSVDVLLSLNDICTKCRSWRKFLDVVQIYLNFLGPRKIVLNSVSEPIFRGNVSAVVHATSQIAKVRFDGALDVLMLLSYMTSISGQLYMSYDDVSKIKLELIPRIQEIVTQWHIILFFGSSPSESPVIEDFALQLSSLQIDSSADRRLRNIRLGRCEYSYAFILFLEMQSTSRASNWLPSPSSLVSLSSEFTSWIIWGRSGEESCIFVDHSVDLALILLKHGQYKAAEYLLMVVDGYSRKEKSFESLQAPDGKLAVFAHLLGCCLVAQTHGLHGLLKDRKVGEAVRCFFRAASLEGSFNGLQVLPREWLQIDISGSPSTATWKLHYFQWIMQLFEQHNISEAACQFAFAALEQVDEAFDNLNTNSGENIEESVTSVKGRFWGNVFKYSLDLNNYHEAYCAIVSNPDEDSKNICLRRFIIVLYERGAVKMLCNGELPLIGLVDKVARELAWKAERSDLSTRPNPYKLLYAFEMHRHNWRRAGSCMYLYSVRLKAEATVKDHQQRSITMQERLNALSVAINALQLVHPSYAWIEAPVEVTSLNKEKYPHKKPRITMEEQPSSNGDLPQKLQSYLDVRELENEYVLASAEYTLSLANIKWSSTGAGKPSSDLIDLLVESNFYDMAFTIILEFWNGSALKRELERVFVAMSLKCCLSRAPSYHGKERRTHGLLLASSQEDVQDLVDVGTHGHWETLELYLTQYRTIHPRLPLTVAGTLLSTDPEIELPLWLVRIFKKIRSGSSFGMAGNESCPASLFRLYVDYGRYAEAVNLLVEFVEKLASLRPADVIRRKKPCAVWFPYTSVERLWCLLDESIKSGHRVDHCEKLKKLVQGVLTNHLNLLKVDSEDIRSSSV